MRDLISVIMSTYNEEPEWVEQSILSILNQTYSNLEFIIVLDNPKNQELKSLLLHFEKTDQRVKILLNEQNLGLVRSLNKTLQHCNGTFIARLDADDIAVPDRLRIQMDYLKRTGVDFVFSSMVNIDEAGNEIDRTNDDELTPAQVSRKLKILNISNHPTWLVKKEVYDRLGGYKEIPYCEDYDFSLRALNSGFLIGKVSIPLLYYRVRESGISRSNSLQQFINAKNIAKSHKKKRRIAESATAFTEVKNLRKRDMNNFEKADHYYHEAKKFYKSNKKVKSFRFFVFSSFSSRYFFMKNLDYVKFRIMS